MLALRLEDVLKRLRDELSKVPGARALIVFGSVARGDYRPDSDVDLLLVVEDVRRARAQAKRISSRVFSETGVPVTVIVASLDDYASDRTALIRRAKREGKVLWRD